MDALRVRCRESTLFFFLRTNGREGLIVYAIALAISLLGRTALAVRLPTALASAGTVLVVFWLGYLLFGRDEESGRATPWRGLLVGGLGAGLLAVSISQTVLGRTAYQSQLSCHCCFPCVWPCSGGGGGQRVRHGGSWWRIALAGACAGLLPYTYTPAHFTPLLFLLFGLSFVLPVGRGEDGGKSRKGDSLSLLTSRWRAGPLKQNLLVDGHFFGRRGVGGCADSYLFCTAYRPYFFIRSSQLRFWSSSSEPVVWVALWKPFWSTCGSIC